MAYEPDPRDWEQKSWLQQQYWGEMMSVGDIAEEVGMSRNRISKEFNRHGIPRRAKGYKPDNSVSPFEGFYNGDENAQTDEESRKHFDPEHERSEEPDWAETARKDDAVGEAAIF